MSTLAQGNPIQDLVAQLNQLIANHDGQHMDEQQLQIETQPEEFPVDESIAAVEGHGERQAQNGI